MCNSTAAELAKKEERKKDKRNKKMENGDEEVDELNEHNKAEESDDDAAGAENSGNDSEDRSEPFMTPSNSATSLVDVESAAANSKTEVRKSDNELTAPKSVDDSEAASEAVKSNEDAIGSNVSRELSPSPDPQQPQSTFSGGEMLKSPTFLALLFLGKLSNVVKKKQKYRMFN